MNFKHTWVLTVLLINGLCLSAQQINVVKVDGQSSIPAGTEGFFYSLPQTVIQVDLTVARTQKLKGPYAEYADQLLGLTQVTTANSTSYELQKIRITSFARPDPAQYYFVAVPRKQKEKDALQIYLTKAGLLSGAGAADTRTEGQKPLSKNLVSAQPVVAEIPSPNVMERMDTIVRKISLDTTVIEQKFFRKTSSAKTTEQKAREAADFIMKLDESMYNLTNGYQEVNYEKGTMEYMYNRMNSAKQDYLELFKGITSVSYDEYTYYFVAEPTAAPVTLCRFSPAKGILGSNAASGDPVQIQAVASEVPAGLKEAAEALLAGSETPHGIRYRIPAMADVTVSVGGAVKMEIPMNINQLGIVAPLPATGLKEVKVDRETGALRKAVVR